VFHLIFILLTMFCHYTALFSVMINGKLWEYHGLLQYIVPAFTLNDWGTLSKYQAKPLTGKHSDSVPLKSNIFVSW